VFENDDANLNAEVSELSTDEDPDKVEHDRNIVQGVTREALALMADTCNIHLSASDLACARQIVPKVICLSILAPYILTPCAQ
jgi:hypothetical protein